MEGSGEVEVGVSLVGAVQGGVPPLIREEMEMESLALAEVGVSGPPEVRQPVRKMALRPLTSRGRLTASRPKSPLLRMAEMRKGGLRGRVLRHSGLKGAEGSCPKVGKGKKKLGGKGLQAKAPSPEGNEACGSLMEVSGEGKGVTGGGSGEGDSGGAGAVVEEVRCDGGIDNLSAQICQPRRLWRVFLITWK